MTLSKLLLGSVAAIALSSALSLMPALAQQAAPQQSQPVTQPNSSQDGGLYGSEVNPPQYSTPAEKEKTRDLNDQSTNGTTTSPAVLNGETPAPSSAVQTEPPQPQNPPQSDQPNPEQQGPQASNAGLVQLAQYAPPNGNAPNAAPYGNGAQADQQYDQQMQQYQGQQQQYQDQQQRYRDEQHRYYRNIREYDQTRWAYEYPALYPYAYDGPRLQRLYLIAEPSQQLADVPIEGPNGAWVGRVRNIEIAPDGRPLRVEVSLNRRVSVWVDPGNFRFDTYHRVLFTNLTRDDLWDMPGATVESGPM